MMSTLSAALILVCLALAGYVQSYPHYQTGLTMADKQTGETALIMRLLQDEMAHVQANECNPAYKNQKYVLQTETLAAMTNVFTHQGGNSRTYLYVPASQTGNLGRELFIRSNGRQSGVNHAEDFMYKTLSSNLPQEFWLTRTPCPQCARNFIARYAKSVKKPTIYVTNFYSRPPYGPQQQQEAIECLAKMRANGFKFLLWDWYQFSEDFLATKECKKVVVDAIIKYSKQEKEERDASFDAIMKAIHIANEIAMGKKDADKLCLP